MNIAITGHRKVEYSSNTDSIIHQACERIDQYFPNEKLIVFSCLAEGADRILSRHLLHLDNATLTVILPLPETDYINDFKTEESKEEYYQLKKLAHKIIEVPLKVQRPYAYQLANRVMLDHCQLVFAIWDGKPPRGIGGTADMIYMARAKQITIIWIASGPNYGLTVINMERIK